MTARRASRPGGWARRPTPRCSTRPSGWASTSCGRCSSSGCSGPSGTPTTTCRTTGPPSTPPACTPTTAASWPTSRGSRPPARPTCATTTRSACSPSRRTRSAGCTPPSGTTGRPTVVGYTERDLDTWATVMARSIRAAGGRAGDKLHNAYGYGLFTGGLGAHYGAEKLGCTVIPISGGMTPRQVQLIQDFQPRVIMVTPSYMLTVIDEFEKQGIDPRSSSLRDRHLRRRAVDRADAPGDGGAPRHRGRRHLRPVGGHGPRRRAGVRRDQGRPAHLGGPLLPGDHRPVHRRGAARGRERASWSSPR